MTTLDLLFLACPDCPIARDARARVLADSFWLHAAYAILPFVVVAVVVRLVMRHLERNE